MAAHGTNEIITNGYRCRAIDTRRQAENTIHFFFWKKNDCFLSASFMWFKVFRSKSTRLFVSAHIQCSKQNFKFP